MYDKLIYRPHKLFHLKWWDEKGENNREKIFRGVRLYRDYRKTRDVNLCRAFKEIRLRLLNYRKMAEFDPDTEEGRQSILNELTIQLLAQRGNDYPLLYLIVETMLNLVDKSIHSSLCLAEIALIHFVDYKNFTTNKDLSEYGDIEMICSILSDQAKPFLYWKVYRLRDIFGLVGDDGDDMDPDQDYIIWCEGMASIVLGDKFKETIEIIRKAAWMLDTTTSFGYWEKGFTQHVRRTGYLEFRDVYETFKEKVEKEYTRNRIDERQPRIRTEIGDVELDWEDLICLYDDINRSKIPANEVLDDDEYKHRLALLPYTTALVAEVSEGELLQQIDEPDSADHNCICPKNRDKNDDGDMFLWHAPGGEPDAYAIYRDFYLTSEVSVARNKSNIRTIGKHAKRFGYSHSSNSMTEYHYDLYAAIAHNIDFRVNKGIPTKVPSFVFVVTKEYPLNDREAINTILRAATNSELPTIIPMTFFQRINFMRVLKQAIGHKDTRTIPQEEWKAILLRIEERLKEIYNESLKLSPQSRVAKNTEVSHDVENGGDKTEAEFREAVEKIILGNFEELYKQLWDINRVKGDSAHTQDQGEIGQEEIDLGKDGQDDGVHEI